MKATRVHGPRDVRIDEIPEPECDAGSVKITPHFNGICGSDLHFYELGSMAVMPHPLAAKIPLTIGHELSGVVTEVGSDVRSLAVGDRVVVNPNLSDGTCEPCLRGCPNVCRQLGFRGLAGADGGAADAMVVPEINAFKVPDSVGLDAAALMDPLAVSWHAVRIAGDLKPSTRALVMGAGPIGCSAVLALRARGVKNVIVSEPIRARADLARRLGASEVIDPSQDDVGEMVLKLTAGAGADAVFDAVGKPASFEAGLKALAVLGTLVNIAFWESPVTLDINIMTLKSAVYKASCAYQDSDVVEVIRAIADGSIKPDDMITRRISLNDLVKDGIEALMREDNVDCKILIDFSK